MSSSLLNQVKQALHAGELDASALQQLINSYTDKDDSQTSKLMKILYFIGGGIVFMGIAFWIGLEWKHFGSVAKIVCTLGAAIAFFVSAVLLRDQDELDTLSSVFFLLSALLMPLGLGVTYDELGASIDSIGIGVQILAILTAVFTASYFLFRKNLLLFIAICFGSLFFFIFSDWLVKDSFIHRQSDFHLYRIFFMGLAWMLLGYAFSDSRRASLTSWLYFFGVIAVLGTGLALGNWKPNQNAFWELIYPGLALGIVFLSTIVKSRSFLIFGSLGFGAYLCKITAEYFSNSLGWPLALILMGSMFIGIAFGAMRIKNRYFLNNTSQMNSIQQ